MSIIITKNGREARKLDPSPPQQESDLQRYISENPMAIPIEEIAADARLLIVGREFGTDSGPIDVLAIDDRGSVYVIETKLYNNPDKRRVVAQVLDYGAALWKSYGGGEGFLSDLDAAFLGDGLPLRQRVAASFEKDEPAVAQLLEAVKRNLADGRIHFIVLMDKLHDRLRDLILFLNEKSRFSLYAVEMEFYRHEGLEIVIPRLFGAQVVKDVKDSSGPTEPRYQWDAARFVADVQASLPSFASDVQRLIDMARELGDVEFKNADFRGKHAKMNILLPPLSARPLLVLWSEDGSLEIKMQSGDASESARSFRKHVGEGLIKRGVCRTPRPQDEGAISLEPSQWTKQVEPIRSAIRESLQSG